MYSKRAVYVLIAFATICMVAYTSRSFTSRSFNAPLPEPFVDERRSPLPIADRTFLLLKTGIEVAYTRLPAHYNTTFVTFPHHAAYADDAAVIENVPVYDALSFLDEKTLQDPALEAYRVRRQGKAEHWLWNTQKITLPDDPITGWSLDRFKNVPAFAHAYINNPGLDWYVMIDADSYILASTLQEVVRGKSPDDLWYFGKSIGSPGGKYAHGGSGIVFSRGAMAKMFGNSSTTARRAIKIAGQETIPMCCGDESVSWAFRSFTGMDPDELLQENEVGQFQGDPIWATHTPFSEWCNPMGTFHHLDPWEVEVLFDWETAMGTKAITYADFYREFIMPTVVPEKRNWFIDYSNMAIDISVLTEDEAQSKELCVQACENDDDCTMWLYTGNEACVTFRNSVGVGKAMNAFSPSWKDSWSESTLGYMVDRIQTFRHTQYCDTPMGDNIEGYAYNLSEPGSFQLTTSKLLSVDSPGESEEWES